MIEAKYKVGKNYVELELWDNDRCILCEEIDGDGVVYFSTQAQDAAKRIAAAINDAKIEVLR